MNTDRLTFWANWYMAARQLPAELRLAWYDAVLDYAFEGREPATGGALADSIAYQAVQMVRATIGVSRRRREAGAKGGSKQNASKRGANAKQNGSKTEANAEQTPSKTEAKPKQEQEQVQEQDQEHNVIRSSATTAHTRGKTPTLKQFVGGAITAGIPESFAEPFYRELVEAGWADKDGRHIANWRRYLKTSYADWQKKICAARVGTAEKTLDDYPDA